MILTLQPVQYSSGHLAGHGLVSIVTCSGEEVVWVALCLVSGIGVNKEL